VVCANPIFPTTEFSISPGATFAFEVFEVDAQYLNWNVPKERF